MNDDLECVEKVVFLRDGDVVVRDQDVFQAKKVVVHLDDGLVHVKDDLCLETEVVCLETCLRGELGLEAPGVAPVRMSFTLRGGTRKLGDKVVLAGSGDQAARSPIAS